MINNKELKRLAEAERLKKNKSELSDVFKVILSFMLTLLLIPTNVEVQAAISIGDVNSYTNIYDTPKSNVDELQYEIHLFETTSTGIKIGGWALIPYSQHLTGTNSHEIAIYLTGSDRSRVIGNAKLTNISRTDHLRLNGVNKKCGSTQYNQPQSTCYYDYNNVGFEVTIPYSSLKPGVDYDVHILMKSKATNKKYMSPVYAMNIHGDYDYSHPTYGEVTYTFNSSLANATVKGIGDPVYVRTSPSKTGAIKKYGSHNLYWRYKETYTNVRNYSTETQSNKVSYDKILWWQLGHSTSRYPVESSRYRVINGNNGTGWIANNWTELGGKQAQIQVKFNGSWKSSTSSVSLNSSGDFAISGSHYHTNWSRNSNVGSSSTKFVGVSGTSQQYGSYNDSSRSGNNFSLNHNVKNFATGKYTLSHYTSYTNTPSGASNTNNTTTLGRSVNTGWQYFGNGKKGRVYWDSSLNKMVLEITTAESNWAYGLYTNMPNSNSTNTGGVAIQDKNGKASLYVYGYHYDRNRIGYVPQSYQTQVLQLQGNSWPQVKTYNDQYCWGSSNCHNYQQFHLTDNLSNYANGKYKLRHSAKIDGNSHSFMLTNHNINSGWVTIGDGRTDNLGDRMARVYNQGGDVVLEVRDTVGMQKLNKVEYNNDHVKLKVYSTVKGSNNETINNMYSASHIKTQQLQLKNASNNNTVATFNRSATFDNWGADYVFNHSMLQNLDIGLYYVNTYATLDSGNGATTSYGLSTLTGTGVNKVIYTGDKKVTFQIGSNNRFEIKVEHGIDLVAQKIETYTTESSEDGLVKLSVDSTRPLPFPVDVELELFYDNKKVSTEATTLQKATTYDLFIPSKYLQDNTKKEVGVNIVLKDVSDSDPNNNRINTEFYTSTKAKIELDTSENSTEYTGVVKTQKIMNQKTQLFYERMTITKQLPKTEVITFTSFPYHLTIEYGNDLGSSIELEVEDVHTYMPLDLLDKYLEYPIKNNSYDVEMSETLTSPTRKQFNFPTIYYEVNEGGLFHTEDDPRISETVKPSNNWFIPLNAKIQDYNFKTEIVRSGVNLIDVTINNTITVTKHFVVNPDPDPDPTLPPTDPNPPTDEDKDVVWQDGKVYIRVVDPQNPFPTGEVSEKWKDLMDFFSH